MGISQKEVLAVMAEKCGIEENIKIYEQILKNQKNVGMNESLVDEDGYPRSDIDLFQVRKARHELICLKNDWKQKMKEIEEGLHALAKQPQKKTDTSTDNHSNDSKLSTMDSLQISDGKSFLVVDQIVEGSPASESGLMLHDEIVQFGSVSNKNFKNMRSIGDVVEHSVNTSIRLQVKRQNMIINLTVIPKQWAGKGLLGCNIIPIKK